MAGLVQVEVSDNNKNRFHTAKNLNRADLHVHTRWSDGWWEAGPLAERACELGLKGIAVTDHDEVRGGFALASYCERRGLPLEVWPGCEVSALEAGNDVHVLGIGIENEIAPWQSVAATVDAILEQGGIAVMPHPCATTGSGGPSFEQILALDVPVALETYNAAQDDLQRLWNFLGRGDLNRQAKTFFDENRQRLLGETGGTDAHFRTVGRGLTLYEGTLRDALVQKSTIAARAPGREFLLPQDPVGYFRGLRDLSHRRAERWGDRPGESGSGLSQKLGRMLS